jgi:hypothetical protein
MSFFIHDFVVERREREREGGRGRVDGFDFILACSNAVTLPALQ